MEGWAEGGTWVRSQWVPTGTQQGLQSLRPQAPAQGPTEKAEGGRPEGLSVALAN